jgi:hypothetical protein
LLSRVRSSRRCAFALHSRLGRAAVVSAAAAIIAACGASPSEPSGTAASADMTTGSSLSMASSQWSFRYSPGMPATPASSDGGWQFAFPNSNGVEYLTTAQHPPTASRSITASIAVETVGSPFFEYRTEAINTCDSPAAVHLFFQRHGDDMSGNGAFEFYRWWSNPVAYQLGAGSIALTGDLTDPSQWTSVFGQSGAGVNEPAFRAALADLGAVGFTFGGGCFFGHGVYVTPGTGQAVFKATQYVID